VIATLGGLLVATALAFVETERLKLVPSPILDTVVSKAFAPLCHCRSDRARILFRLRRPGLMSVLVISGAGRPVRRLAAHRFGRGFHLFAWYGLDGTGQPAPEGSYRIKVHLVTERRTIVLPNIIRLDRTPPTILSVAVDPKRIVPSERLRVRYRFSEQAHPLLFIDGRLVVRGRWPYPSSSVDWYGRIDGSPVRPGAHELVLRARDLAGNLGAATAPIRIVIRRRATHRPP
jgi:hypothetical protein